MQSLRAALAWLVIVLICGLVERRCGHTRYDFRTSREGCTRRKLEPDLCFSPAAGCFEAATLQLLSPHLLSSFAANAGPLLTWLPLVASSLYLATTLPVALTLSQTILWYLGVIGVVRHLHLLLGWDPSGHLIVYGAQLVPLSHLWHDGVTCPWIVLGWFAIWASLLLYLSAMTAVGFHTLSETVAAASLVLLLAAWVSDRRAGGPRGWQLALASFAWALPTASSWIVEDDSKRSLLFAMLVYDSLCWLLLLYLLRLIQAAPDVAYERLCGATGDADERNAGSAASGGGACRRRWRRPWYFCAANGDGATRRCSDE